MKVPASRVLAALLLIGLAVLSAVPAMARPRPRRASRSSPATANATATVPIPSALSISGAPIPEINLREKLRPYLNTRSANYWDWSADGNALFITTRFGSTPQLHRLDAPLGARHQLTFFEEPVVRVRAASGGRVGRPFVVLAKDSGGGENYQLFRLDRGGERPILLTDGKSRNATFELSRDGRLLAFSSNARNGKDMDIYVMDPQNPASRRLLIRVNGDFEVNDLSRDATRLLVTETISANESYIHEVEIASGKRRTLTPRTSQTEAVPRPAAYRSPRYLGGDGSILVLTDRHGEFRELVRMDPSGEETSLSSRMHWNVDNFAVSPDGRLVAFVVDENGIDRLYLLDTRTVRELPTPQLPAGVIGRIQFDPDGARLGFSQSTPRSPQDVFSLDVMGQKITRWTQSEAGGLDTSQWVLPEQIRFPTFDRVGDKPRTIPAFYFLPTSRSDGERLPVVILIHGGPEAQWRPSFDPFVGCLTKELRVAVLAPNVRGSDGYGKSCLLLDNGTKREDSIRDVGALLDWITTRPELDPSRVAVYGGSYGGFMTLSCLYRYPDRIRAGLVMCGISNLVSFLERTKDYRRDLRRAEYGDERDPGMRKYLVSISPLSHVDEFRSPLLCFQGANDPRVPATEAEQIVEALRSRGVDAWYVLARNEGHGFAKKENQDIALLLRVLFLQKNLLSTGR